MLKGFISDWLRIIANVADWLAETLAPATVAPFVNQVREYPREDGEADGPKVPVPPSTELQELGPWVNSEPTFHRWACLDCNLSGVKTDRPLDAMAGLDQHLRTCHSAWVEHTLGILKTDPVGTLGKNRGGVDPSA